MGENKEMEVDLVIGADGANSKVAKAIGAGEYDFAIAFQERMRIPDDKMKYYEVFCLFCLFGNQDSCTSCIGKGWTQEFIPIIYHTSSTTTGPASTYNT